MAAVALLLVCTIAGCGPFITESDAPTRNPNPTGLSATVTRIVDGDTIIVTVRGQTETVRLLGIDTPEKPGGPRPGECFGEEASAKAAALMPSGTQVRLSRDQETRDQYGRLLAFVHRIDDDLFVNQTMVAQGYATPLFFAPNTSAEALFHDAADDARRQWLGFWEACGSPDLVLPP